MSWRKEVPEEMIQRFTAKFIVEPSGCWRWTATTNPRRGDGQRYGRFHVKDRMIPAHRFSFEATKGPVPDGLEIDHVCQNTLCVNPSHLRAVTPRENILAGASASAMNFRKTHCKRGHEFNERNTHKIKTGGRACRQCWRDRYLEKQGGVRRAKKTQVECVDTGERFPSIQEAARKKGLNAAGIYYCLTGRQKKCGGMRFRALLINVREVKNGE